MNDPDASQVISAAEDRHSGEGNAANQRMQRIAPERDR